MSQKTIIYINDDTLRVIEEFTELAVKTYQIEQTTKSDMMIEIKTLAYIALDGLLRENPNIFRYKKYMQAVRDGKTILADGQIMKAYTK